MIARLLFILALSLAGPSHAAWVKPLPREFTANEHCQPYQTYESAQAQIRIGWCHTDDTPPPGMWMWRLYVWQWCLKSKCNTVPAGFSLVNAIDTVVAAADPVAAIATLAQQLRIPVATGSAEEAHLLTVYSQACKAMTTAPFPGAPPQGWSPGWVFPADFCPPEPVPPVTTEVWTTPAVGTFRLYTFANGKLLAAIAGRTAGPNQLGNCAVTKIASGTSIYCPVANGSQAEVTLMKRVP